MKKNFKSFAVVCVSAALVLGSVFSSFAAYKGTKNGDYPGFATFSKDYTSSVVSENTVVSTWSGFSMTLPSAPVINDQMDDNDWYYTYEDVGTITNSYYQITKYGAADLATFVNGMVVTTSSSRGIFVGGALTSATPVTLGSLQFYQLARAEASPNGTYNDYCYVRQVPGTNYVQVLIFDNEDVGDTLNSLVGTIA